MDTEFKTPTMKDLIEASAGYNDDIQIPNASCVLYLDIFHLSGVEPTPVEELNLIAPTVSIFRHAETSMITLTFPSKYDKELAAAYSMLETFADAKHSMEDNSDFPMVRLVVIPNKYGGRYYIVAANPILWTLAPAGVDGEPRVLRFAVADENINAFDGGEEEINAGEAGDAELGQSE